MLHDIRYDWYLKGRNLHSVDDSVSHQTRNGGAERIEMIFPHSLTAMGLAYSDYNNYATA